jgi:hypothetical protein
MDVMPVTKTSDVLPYGLFELIRMFWTVSLVLDSLLTFASDPPGLGHLENTR